MLKSTERTNGFNITQSFLWDEDLPCNMMICCGGSGNYSENDLSQLATPGFTKIILTTHERPDSIDKETTSVYYADIDGGLIKIRY